MLAREHRLRSSDEIREVVKSGKRVSNSVATIHFLRSETTQFAVVTSKALGNAVVRNRARRRAKAALVSFANQNLRIRAVVRLRSEAGAMNWEQISSGLTELIGRIK
jgi:ribonuclease P protein component